MINDYWHDTTSSSVYHNEKYASQTPYLCKHSINKMLDSQLESYSGVTYEHYGVLKTMKPTCVGLAMDIIGIDI